MCDLCRQLGFDHCLCKHRNVSIMTLPVSPCNTWHWLWCGSIEWDQTLNWLLVIHLWYVDITSLSLLAQQHQQHVIIIGISIMTWFPALSETKEGVNQLPLVPFWGHTHSKSTYASCAWLGRRSPQTPASTWPQILIVLNYLTHNQKFVKDLWILQADL